MQYTKLLGGILSVSLVAVSFGQLETQEQGLEWGGFYLSPEIGAGASYDNRVQMLPSGAEGDMYGEATVGLSVKNLPAKYEFSTKGEYGYRSYSDYTELNDDFYSADVALGTSESRLNWKLSAEYDKALNYDTAYDPDKGAGLDSILVNEPNTRFRANGSVSYGIPVSERSSLVPAYIVTHYDQDFSSTGAEEWQVHKIAVPMVYAITDKTLLSFGGSVAMQVNDEEEGYIGSAYIGAQSRTSDKTSFNLEVGVSSAKYDSSGSDFSGTSDARFLWKVTDKVQVFVFGGNGYQPGYGGGPARMVYRAGYGAQWSPLIQWTLLGQGLHDYEQTLGSDVGGTSIGGVRHFFDLSLGYKLMKWAELGLVGRYVNDEVDEDQIVVSAKLNIRL